MCSGPWKLPNGFPVKCGQCMECRLGYSREWAIRMTHEQISHARSCFLTLTYDRAHLPAHGQLVKRDLQLFLKRLRKNVGPLRYVACGEYGERHLRPHFHVALYGHDFAEDRLFYKSNRAGQHLYTSRTLGLSWTAGVALVGELTFESCAYIARYITKRLHSSDKLSLLPLHVDAETGEIIYRNPEFLLCSKGRKSGEGIGGEWFKRFFDSDVLSHGRVITSQGTPAPVPRYYKKLLGDRNPWFKNLGNPLNADKAHLLSITEANFWANFKPSEESPERRAVRTTYAKARTGIFKRDLGES